MNVKVVSLSVLALMTIIIGFVGIIPFSFADGTVTLVQNNFNEQQDSLTAICRLTSPVIAGDSLLVTLDGAFIDRTTIHITDALSNTWKNFTVIVNSASTWAWAFEAQNIANGGANDNITFTYTDISGRGTYVTTCAEFTGNVNFTQIGGLIVGSASCNTCNLNLTSTLSYGNHTINYFTGWSDSSTSTNTGFAYTGLIGFSALSGSDSCQTISGSSNCILAFHAESDAPIAVGPDSGVSVSCSPACSQTPVFALTFYSSCISGCAGITATSTITGFLVPNFVNGQTSFSWLYFLIVVLVPMAEIIGVLTMDRSGVLDRNAMIFVFLSLLLVDSIFGVMLNVVTVAMPFIFGILFGIYLWRGRG